MSSATKLPQSLINDVGLIFRPSLQGQLQYSIVVEALQPVRKRFVNLAAAFPIMVEYR